jgi:hypothetical protein
MSERFITCARVIVVCAFATLVSTGCYTFRADVPGHARADLDDKIEIIGSIDETFTHTYFIGGLVNPPPEDMLEKILLARVREARGDGIANLVFESVFAPPDVLLRTFTVFIVAPRTYRVRADIVRIHAEPLPGDWVLDDKSRGSR